MKELPEEIKNKIMRYNSTPFADKFRMMIKRYNINKKYMEEEDGDEYWSFYEHFFFYNAMERTYYNDEKFYI